MTDLEKELVEALDPDTLDAIAVQCAGARLDSAALALTMMADRQAALIAKAEASQTPRSTPYAAGG